MKILIAQPIPMAGVDLLKTRYEVEESNHILSKEELIARIKDKDALICTPFNLVDSEVLRAGKNLKAVINLAVGFENIDIEAANELEIAIANVPGMTMQTVAELIFAHILTLARKIIVADEYVRSGKFKEWSFDLMVGAELSGKILGIIGFGSIGQSLVPIARGFGMKVLYNNRHGEDDNHKKDSEARFAGMAEILKLSDFVALTVPLTNETKHLITYSELSAMKPSAFLINASRGSVVKEADLVRALLEKKIAGAGLDVYEFEPKVANELLAMTNTVLTPHIGSATVEARSRASLKAAQNIIDVLETGDCVNVVNREFLKK